MRVILLSLLLMSGCVTRGVNGPCGFIGPNGSYIPCSPGGMPTGAWAYGAHKTYEPRRYSQGPLIGPRPLRGPRSYHGVRGPSPK